MPAFSSADNFATTLAAAIVTTTQTPITVTSATGAPSSGNYVILIDSEQMLVTSGQGSTSWGVTRAYAGTVAATHLNGAPVTLIWTTATLASWGGGDGSVAPGYWNTLSPIGLTGAMAATRYVGGTVSGPPSSGAFLVGDFVVDRSGRVWVCGTAGSPGTWWGMGAGSVQVDVGSSAAQADTNGAYAILHCDAPDYDPGSNWNAGTYTFTAPVAGSYWVQGSYLSLQGTAGDRVLVLYKNGLYYRELGRHNAETAGGNCRPNGSTFLRLIAGDTLSLYANTPGTGAGNVAGGVFSAFLVG